MSDAMDTRVRAEEGWLQLLQAVRGAVHRVPARADALALMPTAEVDAVGERLLTGLLPHLWRAGWQPAEVVRHVRREASAAAASLAELAIRVEDAGRTGQGVDPRWAQQVADLDHARISTRGGWLSAWRRARRLDEASAYEAAVQVMGVLETVPVLDVLVPPPGAGAESLTVVGVLAGGAADDPVLGRIRKLLAKAESTEFEGEAESLTAKAQELMTRHAVDLAAVQVAAGDGGARDDVPRMMRLPVDAPYADAKSHLAAVVARANRCRAVLLSRLGLCSVLGHARDLEVVELLFTSLLVQAQQSLTAAGRRAGAGSQLRSSSFRASFYLGFALRIGERLEAANEVAITQAGAQGTSALPVLRSREQAVQDAFDERYGETLVSSGIRGGYDPTGHHLGRNAADRARLDSGQLPGRG
ncbi:DUF2786 domain-containing protein [Nocardioides nanhaiensis]|uniref:DUF2786 domain-containing protein n=1 Tax=Nocardioides nanhaiensis TaxID=1476871 RepID=A0ABP8W700_9ACTN